MVSLGYEHQDPQRHNLWGTQVRQTLQMGQALLVNPQHTFRSHACRRWPHPVSMECGQACYRIVYSLPVRRGWGEHRGRGAAEQLLLREDWLPDRPGEVCGALA